MSTPAITPDQDVVGNGQGAMRPTDDSQSQPVQQAPDESSLPVSTNQPTQGGTVTPTAPTPSTGGAFESVLSALAGHPRTNYRVDPSSGKMQSDPVTSKASLANHIVAAAIVGMLKGAGVKPGPASLQRAFAAGGQGAIEHNQQQVGNEINSANADFKRQQDITTQKAAAVEQNLRQLGLQQSLSKAELETHQQHVALYSDSLDDIEQNSPDSILGTKVIEAEAKDPKKYPITAQRIPDGVVPMLGTDGKQVKDKDGVPQYENTFTVVDADAKTSLTDGDGKLSPWAVTAQQWGIPAAKSYGQVGAGQQVSVIAANRVQNQVASLQLTQDQINAVREKQGLSPIDLKSMVKEKGQSLVDAVAQYHRVYQSSDPNVDIAAMKANPQAAKYVPTMVSLFGGDVLQKDSETRANQVVEDKKKAELDAEMKYGKLDPNSALTVKAAPAGTYSAARVAQADAVLQAGADQKRQDRTNAMIASGKGTEAMYNFGKDPATGQKLTIDNAPDEFLVDSRTGQPIPLKMVSTLKPSMQETNRADYASSAIHSLGELDKLRASGKLPNGPLTGLTTQALAKAGMDSKDAQAAINFISLTQSAATGAHVGGRFSVPVLQKMSAMLSLNMNDSQFEGAEDAIKDVMGQYVTQGGRTTVAQWRDGDRPGQSQQVQQNQPAKGNYSPNNPFAQKPTQQ